VISKTAGKLRLIEYGPDQSLYGVSFVASGYDCNNPTDGTWDCTKNKVPYAYEYTKVKQRVAGATTYFESTIPMTLPDSSTILPASSQRNTFGQFKVSSLEVDSIGFYSYLTTPSSSDVTFG